MILFYRNYNSVRHIAGTLVKITNYAKDVIEQAGRHFEKPHDWEIIAISTLLSQSLNHHNNRLRTQIQEEPVFYR